MDEIGLSRFPDTQGGASVGIVSRLLAALAVFVTTMVTTLSCAAAHTAIPQRAGPAVELTLLDTVVLPSSPQPPGGRRDAWFGSLSGLDRDPRSGRYLAVIDDRDPARVAWLDITTEAGRLIVRPGSVQPLGHDDRVDARSVVAADLEALVSLPDGTWVASEEGHVRASDRGRPDAETWPPALLMFGADLLVTRIETWPTRFGIGPVGGGVRDNQGFEALTRTPDGRLIAGLEQPLYFDVAAAPRNGRPFGGGRGGPTRLVELSARNGGWAPRREWVYPLDATGTRPGYEDICDDGENGLSELLALDDTRLIALERACLRSASSGAVRNTARLYLADLSGADDASPHRRSTETPRPVAKTLMVDFDTLVPTWPPSLAGLDNFEALAFGPPLPDGSRTLLVVSDDNFRPTQNTVFVWFRIGERR